MFAPTRPINNLSQLSHNSILALAGKYHIHIEVSCRQFKKCSSLHRIVLDRILQIESKND